MRYLITEAHKEPFITQWFDIDNHYTPGMIVYDLEYFTYFCGLYSWVSELGINQPRWIDIEQDHL